jgi:hypothetical protein
MRFVWVAILLLAASVAQVTSVAAQWADCEGAGGIKMETNNSGALCNFGGKVCSMNDRECIDLYDPRRLCHDPDGCVDTDDDVEGGDDEVSESEGAEAEEVADPSSGENENGESQE